MFVVLKTLEAVTLILLTLFAAAVVDNSAVAAVVGVVGFPWEGVACGWFGGVHMDCWRDSRGVLSYGVVPHRLFRKGPLVVKPDLSVCLSPRGK